MRELAQPCGAGVDVDELEQLERARVRRAATEPLDRNQPFGEEVADRANRVDVGVRVLEDHGDAGRPQPPELGVGEAEDACRSELNRAAQLRTDREQPDQAACRHRLSAARLTDEAERLTALDCEAHIGEDPPRPRGAWQREAEPVDPEQRLGRRIDRYRLGAQSRASARSARRLPMIEIATTTITISAPA